MAGDAGNALAASRPIETQSAISALELAAMAAKTCAMVIVVKKPIVTSSTFELGVSTPPKQHVRWAPGAASSRRLQKTTRGQGGWVSGVGAEAVRAAAEAAHPMVALTPPVAAAVAAPASAGCPNASSPPVEAGCKVFSPNAAGSGSGVRSSLLSVGVRSSAASAACSAGLAWDVVLLSGGSVDVCRLQSGGRHHGADRECSQLRLLGDAGHMAKGAERISPPHMPVGLDRGAGMPFATITM